QSAGTGAASLWPLPGPRRRIVRPGLLQPAGTGIGGHVVAAVRYAAAVERGLAGRRIVAVGGA
ncbi:hypothetical protein HMPREF0005_03292, partial [Achromobacter xylosoxidans C54]